MALPATSSLTIERTSRGLTLAGTRITLYAVMDYLKAGWSLDSIREWLGLSETQMADALRYIETHRDEVEAEYETVVSQAEEKQRRWRELNREHLAKVAELPRPAGQEKARTKLADWKKKLKIA